MYNNKSSFSSMSQSGLETIKNAINYKFEELKNLDKEILDLKFQEWGEDEEKQGVENV